MSQNEEQEAASEKKEVRLTVEVVVSKQSFQIPYHSHVVRVPQLYPPNP